MAFSIDCVIDDYEVRGVQSGTSQKGNPFRSIRIESQDGYSSEISCTNSEFFSGVDRLQRGDVITCKVRAVSTKERSFISLMGQPVVKGNAYTGEGF